MHITLEMNSLSFLSLHICVLKYMHFFFISPSLLSWFCYPSVSSLKYLLHPMFTTPPLCPPNCHYSKMARMFCFSILLYYHWQTSKFAFFLPHNVFPLLSDSSMEVKTGPSLINFSYLLFWCLLFTLCLSSSKYLFI